MEIFDEATVQARIDSGDLSSSAFAARFANAVATFALELCANANQIATTNWAGWYSMIVFIARRDRYDARKRLRLFRRTFVVFVGRLLCVVAGGLVHPCRILK